MSADRHQPFHELLAERMDGPLDADRAVQLERHLADCASCRAVAKEYEADRQRLQAIQGSEAPRDLWARTSAALDREVADEADALLSPGFGGSRGPRQFRVAIGSFVAAMLILALTGGQLLPGAPTPGLPTATPFAIPAEAVSYVGVTNGQLTFYRASIGEVCPPPRLDCADGPDGEAVVRFASGVHAREMTLSRSGKLFVSGSDELGEEIFAIVTLPAPEPPSGSASIEPPSASPDAPAASDPAASQGPGETRNPDIGQGDPPTPQPTDGPDILPSPSTDPASDPSAGPSISPPPGASTAVATTQSILKDALATGAAAAWSPDGTTLAFSAMPADHSRGSDVYVWRPGDKRAHAVTDDHASLFASWSGGRVVVSRTRSAAAAGTGFEPETVVIDLESGKGRTVDLERGWLPSVDPSGRFVVYWRGQLADRDGVATPDDGRLYVADWTNIDPWPAPRAADAATHATTTGSESSAEPAASGPAAPSKTDKTAGPDANTSGADDVDQPGRATSADPPSSAPGSPDGAAADPETGDGTSATQGDPTAPPAIEPATKPETASTPFVLERPRAVSGRTRDWVTRWSADGQAYAVWTADPGSRVRGALLVRSAPSADAPIGASLLERVQAGRSFGLGDQRVAWVAPLDAGDGELWVSVWGSRGQGSVKLRRVDSLDAVPSN
ncbi:MAG TPA: zf-HC2 domain-containing protein [Candidatus Limnocylindrales bacterium]|jgi:hypothetical protein